MKALADGGTDPAAVAALAHQRLRATPPELRDTLGACTELNPVYPLPVRLVRLALDNLQLMEQQIGQLDQEMSIRLQSACYSVLEEIYRDIRSLALARSQ